MKKYISPLVVILSLPVIAHASELSYLYKDSRIMAMGGANVATGGYSSSIFSNPAGIANLPKDQKLIVELLGIQASGGEDLSDFATDMADAMDSDNQNEIVDVAAKYQGKPLNVVASNYSSLSYSGETSAFTFGLLSAADLNIVTHNHATDLLNTHSRAYAGITTAYSYTINDLGMGDLKLGLGAKYIQQKSYEGTILLSDLLSGDNLADVLQDKMESDSSGYGIDLGAIYTFDAPLSPSLGLSVLNIGKMDFDGQYGEQPMTVNIGAAIEPNISFLHKTRVALDYVDLLNANKTRVYQNNSYKDYDDTDMIKRIRFGATTMLYDNSWSALELAGGIYQGAYTAGLDFTVTVFRIGVSTYQEQIGPKSGDQEDRRYSVNLGIVW